MTAETNVPRFASYGVPKPKELSPAEKQFWLDEAAREEIVRENHQLLADQARENRDRALQRLGMISRIGNRAMRDMEREG